MKKEKEPWDDFGYMYEGSAAKVVYFTDFPRNPLFEYVFLIRDIGKMKKSKRDPAYLIFDAVCLKKVETKIDERDDTGMKVGEILFSCFLQGDQVELNFPLKAFWNAWVRKNPTRLKKDKVYDALVHFKRINKTVLVFTKLELLEQGQYNLLEVGKEYGCDLSIL